MKTVLLLSLLSVALVGCNSESTSSARKCVYNEQEISCEEFDQITGRTAQTGSSKPQAQDNSPIVEKDVVEVQANGSYIIRNNKLVFVEAMIQSQAKTIDGKTKTCLINYPAGMEFDYRVDERVLEISNEQMGSKLFERRYPEGTHLDNLLTGVFDFEDKELDESTGLWFFNNQEMLIKKVCAF